MGWWDDGILGGDTPLDLIYTIGRTVKLTSSAADTLANKLSDAKKPLGEEIRAALPQRVDDLIDGAERVYAMDIPVYWQVVGLIWLATGVMMPKPIKDKVLEGCDNDEWAKSAGSNSPRGKTIMAFRKAVELYNGDSPVLLPSRGLFDVFADYLK